jgi:hypothetical protein
MMSRDVTRSHERRDWLRGYKPIGQYEATIKLGDKYRTLGDVLYYYTGRNGTRMVVFTSYGAIKFAKVKDVLLICPGM